MTKTELQHTISNKETIITAQQELIKTHKGTIARLSLEVVERDEVIVALNNIIAVQKDELDKHGIDTSTELHALYATAVGLVTGSSVYALIGGAGIVVMGGAVGLAVGAYAVAGSVLGFAGYKLYESTKRITRTQHA